MLSSSLPKEYRFLGSSGCLDQAIRQGCFKAPRKNLITFGASNPSKLGIKRSSQKSVPFSEKINYEQENRNKIWYQLHGIMVHLKIHRVIFKFLISAAVATGLSTFLVKQIFFLQSHKAYDIAYPDRKNDTFNKQLKDLKRDAFRHAYTSARLSELFGRDTAHFLGDLNEVVFYYGENSRLMDYYNNDKGLDYQPIQRTSNPLLINPELTNWVKQKINSGELHLSDTTPPKNYKHRRML